MFNRLLPLFGFFTVILFCVPAADAQTWIRDPNFAPELRNDVPVTTAANFVEAADGRILVFGPFTHVGGTIASTGVAYLRADGTPDPDFRSGLGSDDAVRYAAPLAAGRTLVMRGLRDGSYQVIRLLANGSIDPAFTPIPASPAVQLTRMADGGVLAYGGGLPANSTDSKWLIRFTANGDLDTSFSPAPVGGATVAAIVGQPDGKIVVSTVSNAGSLTAQSARLFRLNANGTQDSTFAAQDSASPFTTLTVQPDGKIVAGGGTTLVRFAADGAADASFAPTIPNLKRIGRVASRGDGSLVVQCDAVTYSAPTPSTVVILSSTGTVLRDLRSIFGKDRTLTLGCVQSDGRLIVTHGLAVFSPGSGSIPYSATSGSAAGETVVYLPSSIYAGNPTLETVSADGSQHAATTAGLFWRNAGTIESGKLDALNRLVVSGRFTHVNGEPRKGIARFAASGVIEGPFTVPEGTDVRDILVLAADGSVIARLSEFQAGGPNGLYSIGTRVVRFRPDGTLDAAFAPTSAISGYGTQWFSAAPDGRVLVGYFSPDDTSAENFRLGWIGADGNVSAVLPTRIPGAGPLSVIIAQTASTAADATTSHYANPLGFASVLADGRILVGGSFTQVDGVNRPYLARLLASGALDTSYVPDLSVFSGRIYPQPPDARGRIVVSGEIWRNGRLEFARIRLLPDGTRDTSFAGLTKVPVSSPLELDNGLPDLSFPRTLTGADGKPVTVYSVLRATDDVVWTLSPLARLTATDVPGITVQPEDQSVVAGRDAVFSVGVGTRHPATYQWYFGSAPIAGATLAYLELTGINASQAGSYSVRVTVDGATYTSDVATLTVIGGATRLANFSARAAASATAPAIAGFVIGDDGSPREWLIRGLGPTLSKFQLANYARDTELSLWRDGIEVQRDRGSALSDAVTKFASRVGATPAFLPIPMWTSTESALIRTLSPGNYTVQLQTSTEAAAPALIELYDGLAGASGSLRNVSLRGRTGNGDNTAILGFVIVGNGPVRVLFRAVGPGLARFGVSGAIADPQLSVYPSFPSKPIVMNTGSSSSAEIAQASQSVGAFPLATRDAGVVLRLEPGAYTAQATSVAEISGDVLIEVYLLRD